MFLFTLPFDIYNNLSVKAFQEDGHCRRTSTSPYSDFLSTSSSSPPTSATFMHVLFYLTSANLFLLFEPSADALFSQAVCSSSTQCNQTILGCSTFVQLLVCSVSCYCLSTYLYIYSFILFLTGHSIFPAANALSWAPVCGSVASDYVHNARYS